MALKPIVVGVDNSPGSALALEWALNEGIVRGCPVRAITCWSLPPLYGVDVVAIVGLDPAEIERDSAEMLAHAVNAAMTKIEKAKPGVHPAIEQVVIAGLPSQELVHESKGAEMIVVGSRGRGGFLGLLLGSTAAQVIHHAMCPVVVCREEAK